MVADVGCGMSCGRESMNKTARSEAMALERRKPIFIFLADAANWSTRESSQLLTKSEVRGERRQASKQTRSCAHCSLVSGQRVQGGTCARVAQIRSAVGTLRYADGRRNGLEKKSKGNAMEANGLKCGGYAELPFSGSWVG